MSKKVKELPPEVIARFEKATGAKVVDAENLIIEYEGKRWRPVKNNIEMMCASFDNVPVLMLGRITWIDESWNPNENDN